MAEVLSQTEVESLLAALDPDGSSGPAKPAFRQAHSDHHSQISLYDFKRPERVSKEQMRAIQGLHEGFSREFGAALSGMLRTIVECKLISVDQLTYSEFVFSLENPTCFNLLESTYLQGHMILDLNPSIIFPIIDRMLGGGRQAKTNFPNRALTEIELRLVSRITNQAIKALENTWINLCYLDLKVSQIESNPQLVQIVPPNEVIVLVSFELTMGEMRGIMNFCIPFNTIEPLSPKLSSDSWSAYKSRVITPEEQLDIETNISKTKVELVAELTQVKLSADDLMGLSVGDVIMTEREVSQGLTLMIEGKPFFSGTPGTLKGHKAVQIGKPISRARDILKEKQEPEFSRPTEAVKTHR
ncbi:Flagellar motor switch protein FliM [Polystyrenella longa]|uniref:Flagellar motor switch protein FliM n=1 Tax=Polystyrenella longa TaxID=2528007 RepID=A0A518CKM1_9PLAN|nr:flagellar motor switch protein FliM [Polystyrenella longa]QDU79767.1 Flagellar motor switch protein FliM [Polystyrenella longa]